jgi:tRNA acetyltransferase TAN1
MSECPYNILVTTPLGKEKVVESIIEELFPEAKVNSMPLGYKGLLLVYYPERDRGIKKILEENPYAEKVIPVHYCSEAVIESIVSVTKKSIENYISSEETFAVRTIRRGRHDFTSIEVNVALGEAIREKTGASVNLSYPDKVVLVNIVGDTAYISIVPGEIFYKKKSPEKKPLNKLFNRIILGQEPYIGPSIASKKIGERLGRVLQSFEVEEYYVALIEPVEALPLKSFLQGLIDGVESRYDVQKKSYGRKVHKTRLQIYDMYTLARMYYEHPIVIVEPEGRKVSQVKDELRSIMLGDRKPLFLLGSRKGVPKGLFRYADLIIDIAPGITLSTETAVSSLLSILGYIFMEESDHE